MNGWRLLRRHLAVRPVAALALIGWSAAESVPTLLSGTVLAAAIDRGFLRGDLSTGLRWLGLLAGVHLVAVVATRRVYPVLADIIEPMRDALVRTVATAALVRATEAGEAPDTANVARVTAQTEQVRQLVSALLRTMRQVVIGLVASVVGVSLLAVSLVPFVAVPLGVAIAVYLFSLPRLASRQLAVIVGNEDVLRQAGPVLRGVRDIVACAAEERAAAGVHRAIDRQAAKAVAAAKAGVTRTIVVLLGGQLPVLLVLIAAPGLTARGRLTVGELTGAVVYLTAHLNPALRTLVQLTTSWGLQLGVVLGRLADTAQAQRQARRGGWALPARDNDLLIQDLTFGYGAAAEPVLRGLDLYVPYGQHLAVVGPSGVGKSTLASLIAGLVEPWRGQVLLGGVPVGDVDRLLPDRLALIPQQAYVFAGTLRENLVYLNPAATDDELFDAVRRLGLVPLLERLGGLDAVVGVGGTELSVAERQLVALARVYLSWATVVLLDEATCHLDPVAEARIEHAFSHREGTLVVIAHRMSSAFRADRILLLDGVRALAGTDAELRAASPLYADLVGYWEAGLDAPKDTDPALAA